MRRVGHQPAARVEQGAGEVEPLLDVDRMGRALQRRAHGLGHAHEAAVEQLQGDGVGRVGGDDAGGERHGAGQADQTVRLGRGAPAGGDGDLGVGPDDQGGTVEDRQLRGLHNYPLIPAKAGTQAFFGMPGAWPILPKNTWVPAFAGMSGVFSGSCGGLHLYAGDQDHPFRLDEPEQPLVGGFEGGFDGCEVAGGDRQGRVGAVVAQAQAAFG